LRTLVEDYKEYGKNDNYLKIADPEKGWADMGHTFESALMDVAGIKKTGDLSAAQN
jgi:hypothetical protein